MTTETQIEVNDNKQVLVSKHSVSGVTCSHHIMYYGVIYAPKKKYNDMEVSHKIKQLLILTLV